jgi:hypothetical protein
VLRLGYKASAEQFAPRQLLEFAVSAELHGMDSCFVSDHFQPWRHTGGHAPFSFAWLAALGERTRKREAPLLVGGALRHVAIGRTDLESGAASAPIAINGRPRCKSRFAPALAPRCPTSICSDCWRRPQRSLWARRNELACVF